MKNRRDVCVYICVCCALYNFFLRARLFELAYEPFGKTKFLSRVIAELGRGIPDETNKHAWSSIAPVCNFLSIATDASAFVGESRRPPIFPSLSTPLTWNATGHKNVDSVNERNWRFLFPSWRPSSRVLFYAPPLHSSSDKRR